MFNVLITSTVQENNIFKALIRMGNWKYVSFKPSTFFMSRMGNALERRKEEMQM